MCAHAKAGSIVGAKIDGAEIVIFPSILGLDCQLAPVVSSK